MTWSKSLAAAVSTEDWQGAAEKIRGSLTHSPSAKILLIGPRGSGKTRACTEACAVAGIAIMDWELSSGAPTMVGSSGLSRFFDLPSSSSLMGDPEGNTLRVREAILIDDVDAVLEMEGNPRTAGVSYLLAIVTDPMRPVILTTTSENPFKILGSSAAGKSIQAALTTILKIGGSRSKKVPIAKEKKEKKEKETLSDALWVMLMESAAGYHSSESLASFAADMKVIMSLNDDES